MSGIKITGTTLGTLTGGPSAISLNDLNNVTITSPANGQSLVYNSGTSEWINSTGSSSFVVASQVEAEAGVENTKGMTPLRVKQAIDANVRPDITINGDSITAASGTPLSSYTQNGVTWTHQYSAGILVSRKAFAGTAYELLINVIDSDPYFVDNGTDNILVNGGCVRVSWAQAVALGDAIVAATITMQPGFKIFVHDLGGGTTLEWSPAINWWRGVNGAPITIGYAVNESTFWTSSAVESAARYTISIPGKLVAPVGGQVIAYCLLEADNGTTNTATAGSVSVRWKYDSNNFSSNTSGTGVRRIQSSGVLNWTGSSAQMAVLNGTAFSAASTSNLVDLTVDSTLSRNLTLAYQLSTSTDRARYRFIKIQVQN